MENDPREARIVRLLRGIILVMIAVGMLAAGLADKPFRVFVLAFFMPVGWVYWRPRAPQILVWNMWAVPVTMMGLMLLSTDHVASMVLMGQVLVVLVCCLPLVRRTYKTPRETRTPKIPRARVVR